MKVQLPVLAILAMLLAVGCGDAPATVASAEPITCSTFYRSSVTKAPKDGPVLVFDQPEQSETAAFEELTFRGSHVNDEIDQRSLQLEVTEPGREHSLVSNLYQMQLNDAPANIFGATGQGFTGLVYVYSSKGAELQFMCVSG